MRTFWVYILGSRSGTRYVGVTKNLERRPNEHGGGGVGGFTAKYAVHRLLYF